MSTIERTLTTSSIEAMAAGRRVVLWHSEPLAPPLGRDKPTKVVLCPGFGRRMCDLGPLTLSLSMAGCTVYRVDPLDHVGLSDGDITAYTSSATLASLTAAADVAMSRDDRPVTLVAASLAGRPAIRLAATDQRIARLVLLVGVVHGRRTIAKIFGTDLAGLPASQLPPSVTFDGHVVEPQWLWSDDRAHGWGSLESTISELASIDRPVAGIYASDDPWICARDVARAFDAGGGASRALTFIDGAGHDLSATPAVAREALRLATKATVSADVACTEDVLIPDAPFRLIKSVVAAERRSLRRGPCPTQELEAGLHGVHEV